MKTLLAAVALITFGAPAFAQSKPVLPTGSWGDLDNTRGALPQCSPKPFLVISENNITINLEAGQGSCKIKSIKNKSASIIHGKFNCIWDKTIPPEELGGGDSDADAFSIVIKSDNKILYNNAMVGRCPVATGARQ